MFSENLKKTMDEKKYTLTKLSTVTGIGKSSISQYLSGKNVPSTERIKLIANVLGVPADELDDARIDPDKIIKEQGNYNMKVKDVAKILGIGPGIVYASLKDGTCPFGWAVKKSSKWTPVIPSVMFTKITGIEVESKKK